MQQQQGLRVRLGRAQVHDVDRLAIGQLPFVMLRSMVDPRRKGNSHALPYGSGASYPLPSALIL